jgi:peptidoglycan hydrolase-like protein with peptidoglycan-binding domain
MNTIGSEDALWKGDTVFSRGDSGVAVRQLQKALNRLGVNVAVDGNFDWRMERKVRRFQREKGVRVSGEIGPGTKNLLDRESRRQERQREERAEEIEELEFRKSLAGGALLATAGVGGALWYLNQRS